MEKSTFSFKYCDLQQKNMIYIRSDVHLDRKILKRQIFVGLEWLTSSFEVVSSPIWCILWRCLCQDGVRLNEVILFINRETKQCEDKLNEAKPQLEAAKLLVSNISKAELNEIRSLKKPPAVVELVMTAVAIILKEEKPKNWREIQKNLLNDTKFVRNVLQFDTMRFGKKARKQCTQVMEHKDFNEERANKASKVAGPLVKWSQSQCFYAKMLEVVRH
eukprot:906986_1